MVATALIHEVNGLVHTIDAASALIQVGSHYGTKWTGSLLAGAVGAAHGLMFSARLPPGPPGARIASILTCAAIGVLASLKWMGLYG
jgi:hypothetical protein